MGAIYNAWMKDERNGNNRVRKVDRYLNAHSVLHSGTFFTIVALSSRHDSKFRVGIYRDRCDKKNYSTERGGKLGEDQIFERWVETNLTGSSASLGPRL